MMHMTQERAFVACIYERYILSLNVLGLALESMHGASLMTMYADADFLQLLLVVMLILAKRSHLALRIL